MAKTESVWIKEEVEEDSINDNDKKVKMELLYIAGGSQLNPKAMDNAVELKEELIDVKYDDIKHEVSQHYQTVHEIKIPPYTAIGPTANDNTCSVDKFNFSEPKKTNNILMPETELTNHSKTHTKKQPFEGTSSDALQEDKTISHTKKHKGKNTLYACNMCDYRSDRKNNFKVHLKRHAGEKKFDCSFCDYKSIDRSGLALHMQRKHTNEKQFSCKTCDYKSGDKAGLRLHTKFIHMKEKPFACSFCDYKSVLRGNLNQHLNRHMAAKQFACELCNYKSVDKSGLEKHVKRMHVDEKLFDCSVCDYKAVVKSDLHKHMRRRHKGLIDKTGMKSFGCNSCDYKSATKRDLEQHIKCHIEEKPFVCNVYDYKTHCNTYLKQEN